MLIELYEKWQVLKKTPDMREILELGAGKSFGELSLQNDEPRNSSVYAKTDVHFLIVNKEQFKKNLLKAEQRK